MKKIIPFLVVILAISLVAYAHAQSNQGDFCNEEINCNDDLQCVDNICTGQEAGGTVPVNGEKGCPEGYTENPDGSCTLTGQTPETPKPVSIIGNKIQVNGVETETASEYEPFTCSFNLVNNDMFSKVALIIGETSYAINTYMDSNVNKPENIAQGNIEESSDIGCKDNICKMAFPPLYTIGKLLGVSTRNMQFGCQIRAYTDSSYEEVISGPLTVAQNNIIFIGDYQYEGIQKGIKLLETEGIIKGSAKVQFFGKDSVIYWEGFPSFRVPYNMKYDLVTIVDDSMLNSIAGENSQAFTDIQFNYIVIRENTPYTTWAKEAMKALTEKCDTQNNIKRERQEDEGACSFN